MPSSRQRRTVRPLTPKCRARTTSATHGSQRSPFSVRRSGNATTTPLVSARPPASLRPHCRPRRVCQARASPREAQRGARASRERTKVPPRLRQGRGPPGQPQSQRPRGGLAVPNPPRSWGPRSARCHRLGGEIEQQDAGLLQDRTPKQRAGARWQDHGDQPKSRRQAEFARRSRGRVLGVDWVRQSHDRREQPRDPRISRSRGAPPGTNAPCRSTRIPWHQAPSDAQCLGTLVSPPGGHLCPQRASTLLPGPARWTPEPTCPRRNSHGYRPIAQGDTCDPLTPVRQQYHDICGGNLEADRLTGPAAHGQRVTRGVVDMRTGRGRPRCVA